MSQFFMYVLLCKDQTFYTGYTVDLEKRIATHNAGKGAKYTRVRTPVTLLYAKEFATKEVGLDEDTATNVLKEAMQGRQKSEFIDADSYNDIVKFKNFEIQREYSKAYGEKIAQLFQIPVEYQDERLTTVAAERMLIEQADVSRSKRKKVIDKLAAQLILQNYLDRNF